MSFEFQHSLFGNTEDPEISWHQRYRKVLSSTRWKLLRQRLIGSRGGCERCGSVKQLEIHHITYERLGRELDSDLLVLCPGCHSVADAQREIEVARCREQRSAESLYIARVHGFARKKYGEDWHANHDLSDVYDDFDKWADRHDY